MTAVYETWRDADLDGMHDGREELLTDAGGDVRPLRDHEVQYLTPYQSPGISHIVISIRGVVGGQMVIERPDVDGGGGAELLEAPQLL